MKKSIKSSEAYKTISEASKELNLIDDKTGNLSSGQSIEISGSLSYSLLDGITILFI